VEDSSINLTSKVSQNGQKQCPNQERISGKHTVNFFHISEGVFVQCTSALADGHYLPLMRLANLWIAGSTPAASNPILFCLSFLALLKFLQLAYGGSHFLVFGC